MLNVLKLCPLSDKFYVQMVAFFLFLLGSQLFVNHWFIFVFFSLFLIDWKNIFSPELFVLVFFLFSLYGINDYTHRELYYNGNWIIGTIGEVFMIIVVYLLGAGLRGLTANNLSDERKIFYLLYGFFIAYVLAVSLSYYILPQTDPVTSTSPLTTAGIRLFYMANESMKHVHYGRLISTIIAYCLTVMVTMIPLLIFYFSAFRERLFKYSELFALGTIAIFSLYFAARMGRRMTILVLVMVFLIFSIRFILRVVQRYNLYRIMLIFSAIVLMIGIGYYYMMNMAVMEKIAGEGFTDGRIGFWISGLQCMMENPWGGGGNVLIHGHHYAHNAWIDIGKWFGVLPFVGIVAFTLMHIRYLVRIMRNNRISGFMKNLIFIIFFSVFASWMIEPVFLTHKSFFFYSIFFLGFLKAYSDLYSDTAIPKQYGEKAE